MNYAEGRAYTHTFAGKDYNDRHRIKRKVERWRAKYAAFLLLKGWRSWWRLMRLTRGSKKSELVILSKHSNALN